MYTRRFQEVWQNQETHMRESSDEWLSFPESLPLPLRIWWPWDEPAERVGFERVFSVPEAQRARLYISASGPYRVWLDGEALAVPPGALPTWRVMARIPVSLTTGQHRLCIEAMTSSQAQPFLLACLDWGAEGHPERIPTDGTWWMVRDPQDGWAGRPRAGEWRRAWAFDGVWAEPWGMPCNAPDDFCRLSTGRQIVHQDTLQTPVAVSEGLPGAGEVIDVQPDGSLSIRPLPPYPPAPPQLPQARPGLEWYRSHEAHSLRANTWLEMFLRRARAVVFDVGEETFARVRVRVVRGGPAILALSTGESRQEVERYARRTTDVVVLQDGEDFVTSPIGFRYLKLMALSAGKETLHLEPVVVQHIRYPATFQGSFRCSDDLLNKIWDASVRTVHLCMQNEVWDGIKRDQLPWMGDLYVEALAIYHALGDPWLVRRTFAVLGELGPAPVRPLDTQMYPGLVAIWRAASGYINDIPTYTLWWLVGLADYVRYTGDISLLQDLRAELVATLQLLVNRVGDDGIWHAVEGWDFVDWAPLSAEERAMFTHLLAAQALGAGTDLLRRLGISVTSYAQAHARVASAARRMMQDTDETDWRGHHVPAMAIRSGVLTAEEARELFSRTLQGHPPLRMTCWHCYANLDAPAWVGAVRWGLD
ncbi:MAG TPA: hypothetical protein ENL34_06745, partial [Chloroflexi bacterium]|nr:hypothetical protein [Chloroflexota bacterium]